MDLVYSMRQVNLSQNKCNEFSLFSITQLCRLSIRKQESFGRLMTRCISYHRGNVVEQYATASCKIICSSCSDCERYTVLYCITYLTASLQTAVSVLSEENRVLYMNANESISCRDAVKLCADEFNVTYQEYLSRMKLPEVWGGGPEIVALSNELKVPIHIYELRTRPWFPTAFQLQCTVRFESLHMTTDSPIHILCADGR